MNTRAKQRVNVRNMILCALFAALIAVGAFIRVPVPVVPFTLQFLFANLAGLLLGKKYGAMAAAVYVLIGLAGLPIFAEGGGINYIFKPTFGYLIGFIIGAAVAGTVFERRRSFQGALAAGFLNLLIVYACGMIYLYAVRMFYMDSPIGLWPLIYSCFILVVPGDIVLCFLSAALAKRIGFMTGGNSFGHR